MSSRVKTKPKIVTNADKPENNGKGKEPSVVSCVAMVEPVFRELIQYIHASKPVRDGWDNERVIRLRDALLKSQPIQLQQQPEPAPAPQA